MNEKRLVRVQDDRMFAGVAAGVADYIGIDPVIVRLFFVLSTLFNGFGLIIYLVLMFIMPETAAPAANANTFDEEEIIIKDA